MGSSISSTPVTVSDNTIYVCVVTDGCSDDGFMLAAYVTVLSWYYRKTFIYVVSSGGLGTEKDYIIPVLAKLTVQNPVIIKFSEFPESALTKKTRYATDAECFRSMENMLACSPVQPSIQDGCPLPSKLRFDVLHLLSPVPMKHLMPMLTDNRFTFGVSTYSGFNAKTKLAGDALLYTAAAQEKTPEEQLADLNSLLACQQVTRWTFWNGYGAMKNIDATGKLNCGKLAVRPQMIEHGLGNFYESVLYPVAGEFVKNAYLDVQKTLAEKSPWHLTESMSDILAFDQKEALARIDAACDMMFDLSKTAENPKGNSYWLYNKRGAWKAWLLNEGNLPIEFSDLVQGIFGLWILLDPNFMESQVSMGSFYIDATNPKQIMVDHAADDTGTALCVRLTQEAFDRLGRDILAFFVHGLNNISPASF